MIVAEDDDLSPELLDAKIHVDMASDIQNKWINIKKKVVVSSNKFSSLEVMEELAERAIMFQSSSEGLSDGQVLFVDYGEDEDGEREMKVC